MKFKQLLIPIMAMVFAIGMSFTTEKSTADPAHDYVQTPAGVQQIDEIENCGNQTNLDCMAIVSLGGVPYPVFDSQEDLVNNNPKLGGAIVERITN